jgi:hypothetical protein
MVRSTFGVLLFPSCVYDQVLKSATQSEWGYSIVGKSMKYTALIHDYCASFTRIALAGAYQGFSSECFQGRCVGISWLSRERNTIRIGNAPGFEVSCSDAVKLTLKSKIVSRAQSMERRERIGEQLEPASVPLHILYDSRARIKIRFASQGSANDELILLLFDTGSNLAYLRLRSQGCSKSYGYLDQGRAKPKQGAIALGTLEHNMKVDIQSEVLESAVLEDGFGFDIKLALTRSCPDQLTGAGSLGAAPGSDFSRTAESFVLLPPESELGSRSEKQLAGRMFIQPKNWQRFCSPNEAADQVPLKPDISDVYWIVSGKFGISGRLTRDTYWIIDTGAADIIMTREDYMAVLTNIRLAGGIVSLAPPSYYNVIQNCRSTYSQFPVLEVSIGRYSVQFPPEDYLWDFEQAFGTCKLRISYGELSMTPNTGILGSQFLTKTVVYLDAKEKVVGLCKPRR